MSTSTGSGGHQPATPDKGNDENTGHRASSSWSAPPAGDGKTPQTAAWSSALSLAKGQGKTYLVDGLGLTPRFRRTTLADARSFAQVYRVLAGDTYQEIQQLPAGPMVNPTIPAATGEAQQIAGIVAAENAVSAGGDDAAEAYNATQVHHGDAFVDSDREGNSSDEERRGNSSSASSGVASLGS